MREGAVQLLQLLPLLSDWLPASRPGDPGKEGEGGGESDTTWKNKIASDVTLRGRGQRGGAGRAAKGAPVGPPSAASAPSSPNRFRQP